MKAYALEKLPAPPSSLLFLAGETISGHSVCVLIAGAAFKADNTNPAHSGLVVGMAVNGANAGGEVLITTAGLVAEPSWNLTPDALLFVGPSGAMVQGSPPDGAFCQCIGFALTPTSLFLQLELPISTS